MTLFKRKDEMSRLEIGLAQLCPVKITGVKTADLYESVHVCRCETCSGMGLYAEHGQLVVCERYEKLCRRYYKGEGE